MPGKIDPFWRAALSHQFGAAIEMLDSAIRACPDELWRLPLWGMHSPRTELAEFWYIAYHALFWLDLYLTGSAEGFAPPPPFTLSEIGWGLMPDRTYTREELLAYLEHCRRKCTATIEGMSEQQARRLCRFPWGGLRFGELLLDTMRHVQEHTAQLNMILGQQIGRDPDWIATVS